MKSMDENIEYTNDEPISHPVQDILGREELTKDLSENIKHKFEEFKASKIDGSYNISILGKWGTGKSSFINLVKNQLIQNQLNEVKIEIKNFDPWYFPKECNLHEQLFSLIDNRKSCASDIFQLVIVIPLIIASILSVLNLFALDCLIIAGIKSCFSAFTLFFFPLCIVSSTYIIWKNRDKLNIKKLIATLKLILSGGTNIDILDAMHNGQGKFDSQEAKEDLKKLTKDRKLLIIIDDIDRLNSDQIKRVFDILKGIGNLPNIIYLLSFDQEIVSRALDKECAERGSSYLDKFIQWPITLPYNYKQLIKNAISKKLHTNIENDYHYLPIISEYITTIRELKKFINSVKRKPESMKDNLDTMCLLLLTAIELQDYNVYVLLSNSKEYFVSASHRSRLEEMLNGEPKPAIAEITQRFNSKLERLKPSEICIKVIELLKEVHTKITCISHPDYFDIYFQSSFPNNLVSEEQFKSLQASLTSKDELYKTLLKLLNLDTKKEQPQIADTLKWLDNLAARIVESLRDRKDSFYKSSDDNLNNIKDWLIPLAMVVEKHAKILNEKDAYIKPYYSTFHDFLNKFAEILDDVLKKDNIDSMVINECLYVFLIIYLIQERGGNIGSANMPKLHNMIDCSINNNVDISKQSYFSKIERFKEMTAKPSA